MADETRPLRNRPRRRTLARLLAGAALSAAGAFGAAALTADPAAADSQTSCIYDPLTNVNTCVPISHSHKPKQDPKDVYKEPDCGSLMGTPCPGDGGGQINLQQNTIQVQQEQVEIQIIQIWRLPQSAHGGPNC